MHSTPTPEQAVRVEPLGPHFSKYHLAHGLLVHRFTGAEPDGEPHNHPFSFVSHVLSGGYIEEVFVLHPDGTHTVTRYERLPGTSHDVAAGTVHRLVELLAGECWTMVEPGPWEQKSGFYRFEAGRILFRFWDEPTFRLLAPTPSI